MRLNGPGRESSPRRFPDEGSPATPGQDLTGGQAYAIVAISAGGPGNAAIRRAPPMFHRNQGGPPFVLQLTQKTEEE